MAKYKFGFAIALLVAPIALLTAPSATTFLQAYNSLDVIFLMGAVIVFCTLGAYTLMNVWQPYVTATEAGLIYCIEPLFASVFALILPRWISRMAAIDYPNERITSHLLIGGGLITAANVLIQIDALRKRRAAERVMNPS